MSAVPAWAAARSSSGACCEGHPCDACQKCRMGRCCRKDNPVYVLPRMGDWSQPIFGALGVLARPDGDMPQCHICGESFPSLAHHVEWAHNVTVVEYRAYFGLNWRTRLTSLTLREWRSGIGRRVWEKHHMIPPRLGSEQLADLISKRPRRLEASLSLKGHPYRGGKKARMVTKECVACGTAFTTPVRHADDHTCCSDACRSRRKARRP